MSWAIGSDLGAGEVAGGVTGEVGDLVVEFGGESAAGVEDAAADADQAGLRVAGAEDGADIGGVELLED